MVELKEQELDLGILTDWCLWDWHEDTDYQLTDSEIEWLPTLFMQDDMRFDYNQWKQTWSKKSCTIFAAIWAISDLWNYCFPLSEIKEYNDLSYECWRVEWKGWYTKKAIEMACKKWNKDHPDMPVVFYSVLASDDNKVNRILDKNYDFNISFNYTKDYVFDLNENMEIDRAIKDNKVLISHAVCQIKKDWCKQVKDNYAWSKKQYYKVNVSNKDLSNAWILHYWWFVILKVAECNLWELKRMERVKTDCLNACEYNSRLRHSTNDKVLKNKLHNLNEYIRNNNLKYIEKETERLRKEI